MSRVVDRLRREWRLAEFRLLLVALAFIAAALSAVGLFGNRVEQAMRAQTGALLGADALIVSTRPIDDAYDELALRFGLHTARTVSFLSMVTVAGESQLARVKAVSPGYPLRGEVATRGLDGQETDDNGVRLAPGELWAAAAMVDDLHLAANDVVTLGRKTFRVSREIMLEPEGGMGAFSIAPRVLIPLGDLGATGLVTPASRARFRLLVSGDATAVAAFGRAIADRLSPRETWEAADLRREEVASTVGRVVSYLNLAVLLSVALAVVAMAVAAQGLWRRQVFAGALMRCLGSSHARSVRGEAILHLVAAVPAALVGTIAGALLQGLASGAVQRATGVILPSAEATPAVAAAMIAVGTLLCVTVPLLVAQRRVPVMVLLRAEQRDRVNAGYIGVAMVSALIVLLTLLQAGDVWLALSVLAGLLAAGALFWLLIRGALGLVARLSPARSSAWYIGLKGLTSNARRSAWLASAFGAAVFALVLLGAVRDDLFDAWSRSIPADAPDVFLINIQPDEVDGVRRELAERGHAPGDFYPIFRGRLVAIDGAPVVEEAFDSAEARHRINHEFNLTEVDVLPEGNRVITGAWFSTGAGGYSVEEETAVSLGLAVGSRLTFDVAGTAVEAPVTSIRSVHWDTMTPNFFVVGSPGLFGNAPRTFITALNAGDDLSALTRAVNTGFPSVTLIDLGMILERLRSLVEQASVAVSVLFVFTVVAALLVLIGVLQAQREARRREIALLKTLGASRARIRTAVGVEFGLLGAVAGAVGAALALVSGWLLAVNVFDLAYVPAWRWLVLAAAAGAVVVGTAGYLSIRPLFGIRPVRLLAG